MHLLYGKSISGILCKDEPRLLKTGVFMSTQRSLVEKHSKYVLWGAVQVFILVLAFFHAGFLWLFLLTVPITYMGWVDITQKASALHRNFPVFARIRPLMEELRPFVRQYFLESELDALPIRRQYRTLIANRSEKKPDTIPFGSKVDMYEPGYEWIGHSINALDAHDMSPDLRVKVGGSDCRHPYDASILNISAMSFGALSENAIKALNQGAKLGGFAHNTGEGSITPHHLRGGDIVWQIGTGYFGCRDENGHFCPDTFAEKAHLPEVKMIEIKLSQGAKPGHGGILPATKNTPEIAAIRGVTVNTTVHSPSAHTAFVTPTELMEFIGKLRHLSDGKPIGFKLSIGRRSEFLAICRAMIETEILPDFITVDGGEGGTGAAPVEYSDSIGMPLREALAFVVDSLIGFDLKKHIRVIASGKVFTATHIVRNLSLGADMCNSARGMMIALGCIQSLQCNRNTCPTGIATQNPALFGALDVDDKATRIFNFHSETLKNVMDILSAAGLLHSSQLDRSCMYRRINELEIKRFDEIYPYPPVGCLLEPPYPERFDMEMLWAKAENYGHSGGKQF